MKGVATEPLTITILEGDETGQELLEHALRVLDPEVVGLPIALDRHDLSLQRRRETDNKVDPTYGNCYWNEPEGHMWEMLQVSYARKK